LLSLDLTHPAFLVFSYAFSIVAAGWATWKTISLFLDSNPLIDRIAIFFTLLFADAKFINFNKVTWVTEHNFSFSMVAMTARCWFIFFLLSGRPFWMCVSLLPINLFSLKVGWILTGFALAVMVWERVKSPPIWIAFAIALLPAAYPLLSVSSGVSPEEKRAVFNVLNGAYSAEDNPFAGRSISIVLFPLGSGLLWWMSTSLEPMVRDRIRIVLLISLAVFAGGGIYLSFAHSVWPIPSIVLLSPARALETAGLLIYLLLLVSIVRTQHLNGYEKSALLLAAIFLKITEHDLRYAPTLIFLVAALVLIGGRYLLRGRTIAVLRRFPRIEPAHGIAVLAPFIAVVLSFLGSRAALTYDPAIGFRPLNTPVETRAMLSEVAQQPENRRILFLAFNDGRWAPAAWNGRVRKSSIMGDPYYLARINQMVKQREMNALAADMASSIQGGSVAEPLRTAFRALDVHVIVPEQALPALKGWQMERRYGSWVELAP
jgi:hypothetical protein